MKFRHLAVLCAAHFLVDTVATFLTPLMPIFERQLALGAVATGIIVTVSNLATSFTQPAWGYVSDRLQPGRLTIAGPLVALVGIGLIGVAPNYFTLLALIAFGGLGLAAFHPEGASLSSAASGRHQAMGVALFVISGHLGLGAGPMLAGWIAGRFGVNHSWWIIPPGVVLLGLTAYGLRDVATVRPRRPPAALGAVWRRHQRLLSLLVLLSVFRAFVGITLSFAMPFWWDSLGMSESRIGVLSGCFLFAGGLAGFICGLLVHRGHERRWIALSLVLALPAHWWLIQQHTYPALLAGVILLGATLNATIPVVVVYAQRLLVGGEGVAASLVLGVAWGLGGAIGPPVIRVLQTRFDDAAVLPWLSIGLVLTLICAILLPPTPSEQL